MVNINEYIIELSEIDSSEKNEDRIKQSKNLRFYGIGIIKIDKKNEGGKEDHEQWFSFDEASFSKDIEINQDLKIDNTPKCEESLKTFLRKEVSSKNIFMDDSSVNKNKQPMVFLSHDGLGTRDPVK